MEQFNKNVTRKVVKIETFKMQRKGRVISFNSSFQPLRTNQLKKKRSKILAPGMFTGEYTPVQCLLGMSTVPQYIRYIS